MLVIRWLPGLTGLVWLAWLAWFLWMPGVAWLAWLAWFPGVVWELRVLCCDGEGNTLGGGANYCVYFSCFVVTKC